MLIVATGASGSVALAAEIPSKYIGVWSVEATCRLRSESEAGEFPYLIVTRAGYEAHEVSCKIRAAAKGRASSSDVLTFACSAEGEQSTFKETWSITEKRISFWKGMLTELFLVRKGGEYGSGTYSRCPFLAKPSAGRHGQEGDD